MEKGRNTGSNRDYLQCLSKQDQNECRSSKIYPEYGNPDVSGFGMVQTPCEQKGESESALTPEKESHNNDMFQQRVSDAKQRNAMPLPPTTPPAK